MTFFYSFKADGLINLFILNLEKEYEIINIVPTSYRETSHNRISFGNVTGQDATLIMDTAIVIAKFDPAKSQLVQDLLDQIS